MDFDGYQAQALDTAVYPELGTLGELYPALGLANEAGEVLGLIKKVYRDSEGEYGSIELEKLKGELGDVLWYCAALAKEVGMSLNDIAVANLDKLQSRKLRGVLQGSGGDR